MNDKWANMRPLKLYSTVRYLDRFDTLGTVIGVKKDKTDDTPYYVLWHESSYEPICKQGCWMGREVLEQVTQLGNSPHNWALGVKAIYPKEEE